MSNDEPKVELYPGAEDTHRIVRTGDNAVPVDMSICRDRPQEQRRYLREQLDPRLHSHLPRLYRELGIAEEPAFIGWTGGEDTEALRQWLIANRDKQLRVNSPDGQCDCIYSVARRAWEFFWDGDMDEADPAYIDLSDLEGNWTRSDDGTEACTANKYLRVEMGWPEPDPSIISTELGEFRVERMAHQHWYVYAPWQNAGQPALYAVPVSATVIPANMRQWLSDAVSRDLFARDGGTPAGVMRMLAPVFQRLGIAEEPKPVGTLNGTPVHIKPKDTADTYDMLGVVYVCGRCSKPHGHETSCMTAARAVEAKQQQATRERALKAGESQRPHEVTMSEAIHGIWEGSTVRRDKSEPACTPAEQQERDKYTREKLFAKRSSRPSVGWQPYSDEGEG